MVEQLWVHIILRRISLLMNNKIELQSPNELHRVLFQSETKRRKFNQGRYIGILSRGPVVRLGLVSLFFELVSKPHLITDHNSNIQYPATSQTVIKSYHRFNATHGQRAIFDPIILISIISGFDFPLRQCGSSTLLPFYHSSICEPLFFIFFFYLQAAYSYNSTVVINS